MGRALANTVHAVVCLPTPTQEILASDSEHRPRRGGVRLAYRAPSGERYRFPFERFLRLAPRFWHVFPFVTVRMCDHNSHKYMRARQHKTRDVNFETYKYFAAVEL